jgi:hypothetical protein
VRGRDVRGLIVAVAALLAAGCAPKLTTQQAIVEEAFEVCRQQGPSAKLERVDRDGKFSVVGRETDAQRVHDCMVRYDQASRSSGRTPGPPATAAVPASPVASAPRAEQLLAGRLPGTWRGTLTLPPRSIGGSEVTGQATVRFTVVAGSLRWSLATGAAGPPVAADGSAVVVDGELRMSGYVRPDGRPAAADPARPISVRYAGTMVGDRLEVTGVTGDQQVHLISVRRIAE